MMAVTDIIGFSFFIILPGCLPALLSLVTVDRSISPTFSPLRTADNTRAPLFLFLNLYLSPSLPPSLPPSLSLPLPLSLFLR